MQEFGRAYVSTDGYERYLILRYQVLSQSSSSNSSIVKVQVVLSSQYDFQASEVGWSVNGGAYQWDTRYYWYAGETVLWDNNLTIYHNSSGVGTLNVSATIQSTYGVSGTVNGSASLPTIPRYANITSFSVSKKDETSVTFNWSASSICDYAWYSTNNGSSWTGYDIPDNTSGSFTVSGLSAGTTYNFKLRIRRKDSQLTTTSGTKQQTTYNYPYVSAIGTSNLTIGNSQTLTLYNPLSRNVTVYMKKDNTSGTQFYSGTTNKTSITFTPNSENMYASIPSLTSANCVYYCTYSSHTVSTKSGTYTINANESKPIFEDFDYSTDLSELTGNNETIINGKTTTTITITSVNKAVARNSATINRYSIVIGNIEPKLVNYSNDDVSTTINNCNNDIIKVTAIDSRGLETTITKTIPNFLSYFSPTFVFNDIDREDGIEEEAYLNMELSFWNYSFGLKRNNITSLKYRLKESSASDYSEWYSINLGSLIISGEKATINNLLIFADGISGGFIVGKEYNLQLQVTDGNEDANVILSTIESDIFNLNDGQVAFSILKDNNGEYHIGINGMPSTSYTLKVYGTISNS